MQGHDFIRKQFRNAQRRRNQVIEKADFLKSQMTCDRLLLRLPADVHRRDMAIDYRGRDPQADMLGTLSCLRKEGFQQRF